MLVLKGGGSGNIMEKEIVIVVITIIIIRYWQIDDINIYLLQHGKRGIDISWAIEHKYQRQRYSSIGVGIFVATCS